MYNFLPKLEHFSVFHTTDFCICVFLCALLAGLKWAGLNWKKLMTRIYVNQNLNKNLMTVVKLFAYV